MAPFLVLGAYKFFGSWRPVFVLTGSLGMLWLLAWRWLYYPPDKHPRVTEEELAMIRADQPDVSGEPVENASWGQLLSYKQTWGIVLGRSLLDPYWFLVSDWLAIYLSSKGFSLESSLLGFWIPFLAADAGNFAGGGLSSWLIARGWEVGKARRAVLWVFGPAMLALIPAAFTSSYAWIVTLFAFASFAYAACATIFLSLPADVFRARAVASVSGLSGAGAGLATLLSTYLIGQITDRFSFQPIIIAASIVPCVATALLVTLVRRSRRPDPNQLLNDF
jgi:ACS family hexuronate transporter-like MFS transporter